MVSIKDRCIAEKLAKLASVYFRIWISIMAMHGVWLFMIKKQHYSGWGGAVCVINNMVNFNRVLNVCISPKITNMSWKNHDSCLENYLQLCTGSGTCHLGVAHNHEFTSQLFFNPGTYSYTDLLVRFYYYYFFTRNAPVIIRIILSLSIAGVRKIIVLDKYLQNGRHL